MLAKETKLTSLSTMKAIISVAKHTADLDCRNAFVRLLRS